METLLERNVVNLEAAAKEAEEIAKQCRDGKRDRLYQALEAGLEVLPEQERAKVTALAEQAAKGAAAEPGRPSLPEAMLKHYKAELCKDGSDLHRLADAGLGAIATAVVTTVMVSLAFPPAGIPVAVGIAGVILCEGLAGFCEWSAPQQR